MGTLKNQVMKSVKFPGANIEIGKGQPEYFVIHGKRLPGPSGEIIMCWEISDEELQVVMKTKKIWYHRLTGNGPFQPMRITVEQPMEAAPKG